MCTSRDIVKQTLDFAHPTRVARNFYDSDIIMCFYAKKTYETDWEKIDDVFWERYDEWGNLWRRCDNTSKGEVYKGVLSSLDDIENYHFPDFSQLEDYTQAKNERKSHSDKWSLGALPGFTFSIARKLLKLEEYLCYLITDQEKMSQLHDLVDRHIESMIKGFAHAGMDGIVFWEDWGTQTQTLINPALWNEEFCPRFQKLIDCAHHLDMKVFMHSCGAISEIIPPLVDAGVDVFMFDQPLLHGLDKLAGYQNQYKITIWSPVDIQKILPTGNEKLIRQSARDMIDQLWNMGGGFIADCYGDPVSIQVEQEWHNWACDEFIQYGIRQK